MVIVQRNLKFFTPLILKIKIPVNNISDLKGGGKKKRKTKDKTKFDMGTKEYSK